MRKAKHQQKTSHLHRTKKISKSPKLKKIPIRSAENSPKKDTKFNQLVNKVFALNEAVKFEKAINAINEMKIKLF